MAEFGRAATDHFDPPIWMDGVAYCQVGLCHPFAAVAPIAEEWRLYVVQADGVVLDVAGLTTGSVPLARGTVIGMSGSIPHVFASAGNRRSTATPWCETPLGAPSGDSDAVIAMGRIPQSSMPFLSMMGSFIRIDPDEHRDAAGRIGVLIDWIAEETRRNDPVTSAVIRRLAEIITIEIGRVGRAHSVLFGERPDDAEYDARILRAIAAISEQPERQWTVESMAEIAGMSRSAFAERYHQTVGQTPMRSLRRLRMHRAAMALAAPGSQPIAPLADALGYGSDAAFNRAFSREFGHPPKRHAALAARALVA